MNAKALVWWEPRNAVWCRVVGETRCFYWVVPEWSRDVPGCRVVQGVRRRVSKALVEFI